MVSRQFAATFGGQTRSGSLVEYLESRPFPLRHLQEAIPEWLGPILP